MESIKDPNLKEDQYCFKLELGGHPNEEGRNFSDILPKIHEEREIFLDDEETFHIIKAKVNFIYF